MNVWIVTQSVTDFLSEHANTRILGVYDSEEKAERYAFTIDAAFEDDKKVVENLAVPYQYFSSMMYNALDAIWETPDNNEIKDIIREEFNTKMFETTGYTITDYENLKNSLELCTSLPCEIKCFEIQ